MNNIFLFKVAKTNPTQAKSFISIFILLTLTIFPNLSLNAKVYTLTGNRWNESESWSNKEKPGSTIHLGDEVIIDNVLVTIEYGDLDIDKSFRIDGKLTIKGNAGILISDQRIDVLNQGTITIESRIAGLSTFYANFSCYTEFLNDTTGVIINYGRFSIAETTPTSVKKAKINKGTIRNYGYFNLGSESSNNLNNGSFSNEGSIETYNSLRNGADFTLNNSGQIINEGQFRNRGVLNTSGGFFNNGTFLNFQYYNQYGAGKLNISGGFWSDFLGNGIGGLFVNDTIVNSGGSTGGIPDATVNLNAGGFFEISKTQNKILTGIFNWNAGTVRVGYMGHLTLPGLTIDAGKALEIGGKFTTNSALVNNGTVTVNGNLVLNYANATVPTGGSTVWNSGGKVTVGSAGSMTLNTPLVLQSSRILAIEGTLNANARIYKHSGTIHLNEGGNLIFNAVDTVGMNMVMYGGTITVANSGSLVLESGESYLSIPSGGSLINNGTVRVKTNLFINRGTVTNNNNFYDDYGLDNRGILNNNTGKDFKTIRDLINTGTINNSGLFELSGDGAEIKNENGIVNLNNGGVLYYNRTTFDYPVKFTNGTVNWNSGSKVKLGASSYLSLQVPLTIPVGGEFENNGKVLSPLSFTNNGVFRNNDEFKSYPGGLNNTGTIINSDSIFISTSMTNTGTLTNDKAVVINGGAAMTNSGIMNGNGKIELLANGVLVLNTPNITISTGSLNWNPSGKVSIGPLGTFTLSGLLNLEDSRNFENRGTLNIGNGTELNVSTGSTFHNYGAINVTGSGKLNSNGIFKQFSGNYFLNNNTPISLSNFDWVGGGVSIGSLADLTITNGINILPGNSLTVDGIFRGGLSNSGNIVLNSTGKIYFNNYSNLGQMTWNAGGKIIVNPGVAMNTNNLLTIPSGGVFENYGNVSSNIAGPSLLLNAGSIINIYNAAKLAISSPLTNNGTLNLKAGGEYRLNFDTTLPAPSLNFNWEVGGILSSSRGSLASPYTVPAGRILNIGGGLFSVNKKLTNEGTINLSGSLTITDTLLQNNKFNYNSGDILIRTNAILILNDTLNINQDIWNEGIVKINQGGKINGSGKVDLKGAGYNGRFVANQLLADINPAQYIWNDGSTVIIGENSTFEAPDGFTIPVNTNFQNDGLMQISSGQTLENNGFFTINGTLNDNGTLNNNTGSTFTNNGISNINGSFNNDGTIENTSNLNLNSTGSLALNTGNITLAGFFNWVEGGDLTIGTDANLYLANTLTIPASSTLNVDGLLQINPNGVISNNGLLSLNSGGNFVIKDTTNFITSDNFIWKTGANVEIGTGGLLALSSNFTIPLGTNMTVAGGVLELNPGGVVTNLGTLDLNNYGNIILNENPEFLVNGGFNWNTQGQITIGMGVVLNMATDLTVAYAGILENKGKIIIPFGKILTNNGTFYNKDSLINDGTVININNLQGFIHNDGVFINNGTLTSTRFFYNQGQLVLNTAAAALPGGAFNWSAGDVTVGPNGIFDLSLNISYNPSSKFNIEGILNLNSNGKLSGVATLKSGGVLKINQNASISDTDIRDGSNFTLINTFDWQNGGILEITIGNTLTNTEAFSIPTNSVLRINGSFLSNNTFTNNGIIDLNTGGNLTFQSGNVVFPSGVFNWNGGSLGIGSSATLNLANTFTIPSARTLVNDGTLTIGASGVLINEGTFTNNSVFNLNTNGEYRIKKTAATLPSGTFNWNAGKVSFASPSTFVLTSAFIIPTNGTLAIETDAIFNINANGVLTQEGTLQINGGALNLNTSGVLELNKADAQMPGSGFNWIAGTVKIGQDGTLPLANALNIPVSGNFDIYGQLAYNNGASFNNLGVFNIKSGGNLDYNATSAVIPNGTFNWNAGGNINVNAGSAFNLTNALEIPASSSLINAGTFNINNLGILSIKGTFTNNGITNLNSGGKYLITGSATTVPKANFNWNTGGIFEITSTGTLTLSDSLNIPFQRQLINKGQLTINANGVLTQMGSLDNQGTFDLNDLGYLILKTSPLETNPATVAYPNGNFNWNNGGVVLIAANSIFNNQSPFTVPADRRLIIQGTYQNNSTLDISGEVLMESDIINTSTINLNNGGQMRFNMPNMTFPGGTFNWNTGGIVEVGILSTLALNTLLTVPEFTTLKIAGTLDINASGILSALGSVDKQGNLNINNGGKYLLHKANFINDFDDINWNTGGTIEIAPLASLSISGPTTIPFGRTLKNNGTINIGNGAVYGNSALTQIGVLDNTNGELNINAYGVLELITDPLDVTGTVTYPNGILNWNNDGLIRVPTGSTFKNKTPFNIPTGREFIVDGTLENTSTLQINGAVKVSGSLANSTGGIIDLNDGGNLELSYKSAMKPANTFNWKSGGKLSIGYGGSMNLSSVFNIPVGGIFNIKGAVSLLTGGSLNNLGTVDLEGDLIIDDNNAWIPSGTLNWNGRVVLAKNHIFHLANELTIPISGRLSNKSMLTIDLAGKLIVDGSLSNDSTILNKNILYVSNNGYLDNYNLFINEDTLDNENSIFNYGTITNAAAGIIINHWDINQEGKLYNYGTLTGDDGYFYTDFSVEFINYPGSKIAPGDGAAPGYTLFQGSLDLGSTGLAINIDGALQKKDLLDISGNATITNAILNLNYISPPTSSKVDTIVVYNTKAGQFAQVNYPSVPGFTFAVNYLPNAVTLTTTADCVQNRNITTTISTNQTLTAAQGITANAIISVNAKVTFSAGNAVLLMPGFKAEKGSVFLANVGGCN